MWACVRIILVSQNVAGGSHGAWGFAEPLQIFAVFSDPVGGWAFAEPAGGVVGFLGLDFFRPTPRVIASDC